MVKAIVDISNEANRILNIVKAKEGLKDKSKAIEMVVTLFAREMLEPELRPAFVKELLNARKEKAIKVKHFSKRYS